jgi:ubiquinone/menaquinone biosynthesis C-methylase UbiE
MMSDTLSQVEISPKAFDFKSYIHKKRWNSFYHQIDEVISAGPESVLEIGVGSGILKTIISDYMKMSYKSLDLNKNLSPDFVCSVTDIQIDDNSFDVVCCFQVLEHLPFDSFEAALSEMLRVAKKTVIFSLPNAERMIKFQITHLWDGVLFKSPFFQNRRKISAKNHFWEINIKGFEIKHLLKKIREVGHKKGYTLIKEFRDRDNTYHHFFVMQKD